MTEPRSLQAHVDEAVETYLAEQGGGMVVSSIVAVSFIDKEGEESVTWGVCRGSQKLTSSMGLVAWVENALALQQARLLTEAD